MLSSLSFVMCSYCRKDLPCLSDFMYFGRIDIDPQMPQIEQIGREIKRNTCLHEKRVSNPVFPPFQFQISG